MKTELTRAENLQAAKDGAIDLLKKCDGFVLVCAMDYQATGFNFGFQMFGETPKLLKAHIDAMAASQEIKSFIIEAAMQEVKP